MHLRGAVLAAVVLAAVVLSPAAPSAGAADAVASGPQAAVALDPARLGGGGAAVPAWRFHAGDDPTWAAPGLDDAGWRVVAPELFRRGEPLPAGWRGIGWLRARVEVPAELAGAPLALRLRHTGAAEVFLDGRRVAAAGTVGASAAATTPRYQQAPAVVVFARPGRHLLAVRFANHQVPAFLRVLPSVGVEARFAPPAAAAAAMLAESRADNRVLGGFCGLFLAFALLHLLLFLFYPAMRANLDFAALCLVLTGLVFLLLYRWEQPDPRFLLVSEPAMNLLGLLFGVALLRFVYRVFHPRTPRRLAVYALVCVPVAVWGLVDPAGAFSAIWLLMLAAVAEVARTVGVAALRRRPGARTLGVGLAVLAAGFGVGLLAYLGVLPRSEWTTFVAPFASFVVLLVTMSVYLSRRFAAVHRDLEARLADVERLSAENLEQERLRRAEEVERRVLETRYEEKVRELEEARELQLSMLPRRLPELPDLELAAHMETATEVGGDYYDFALDGDGTLTVAIGDATGHGMRAGTMVTATKGLFHVLAGEASLLDTLARATRAIRRMNLRRMAMALTLARWDGGRLRIAAAGMPPALLFRARSGAVEQILLAGMPLGVMASFPYREAVVALEPGDTVLLMSDGFPERRNAAGDELGYDRATELFAAAATDSAPELVVRLREEARAWAGGRPPDDDLTFVVLKARAAG